MNFYSDKSWQFIAWSFSPVVIAFAIDKHFGRDVFTWLVMLGALWTSFGYVAIRILSEWDYIRSSDSPREIVEEKPTYYPNLNAPVYESTVEGITPEQFVAFTLSNMERGGYKLDLTEKFWIAGGRFQGTREQFAAMREEWLGRGAVTRKGRGKNAKYVVTNMQEVRRIMRGR